MLQKTIMDFTRLTHIVVFVPEQRKLRVEDDLLTKKEHILHEILQPD